MSEVKHTAGDLRVWWIPQVPMTPFYVPVKSLAEAVLILETLATYDIFQFENNIKPDYCNAGGLNVFDPTDEYEWCEWEDAQGNDIKHYGKAALAKAGRP